MPAAPVGHPLWETGVWADTVWEQGVWEPETPETLWATIGLRADGLPVFDNGLDALGNSVTRAASASVPGELSDMMIWFLPAAAEVVVTNFFRRRVG